MSGRGVKDFLGKPAPAGYVAGLGRGATGFVTRPDLGPGSNIAGPSSAVPIKPKVPEADDDQFEDNENEEGLLSARGPLAAEDEEADATFAMIDARMSERRRKPKAQPKTGAYSNPNDIKTMFAADKLRLRQVSADEWARLPESGDFIAKRVKKANAKERYTPVPDSVILSGMAGMDTMVGGEADFSSIGEARERVLGARLDMAEASTGNQKSIDPSEYLSTLNQQAASSTQYNDIRKARLLLKSAILSNPSNASAWIAAAKIEEVSQNLKQARNILAEAIEACPESEDIWVEAVRLSLTQDFSSIIKRGIERLPRSVKLWLMAAEREKDSIVSKKILRQALEENTNSPTLWMALIEREEEEQDALILLNKAVEFCPSSVDLWIALARLESHENARKLLNKARQLNPHNLTIWIAAARLEEAYGNPNDIVSKLIGRAMRELEEKGAMPEHVTWIQEAYKCEETGDFACASAIVKTVFAIDSFMDHFNQAKDSKHVFVAKTFLELAIESNPKDVELWRKLIEIESLGNTTMELNNIYERALDACPESIDLWIEYSKINGVDTISILKRACVVNHTNVGIWLHTCKILMEKGMFEECKIVLTEGRRLCVSDLLWKQAIKLELSLKNSNGAEKLAKEALHLFPKSETLWRMICKLDPTKREEALKTSTQSPKLYIEICLSYFNESPIHSRAILERARSAFPDNENVWLASIKLEVQQDSLAQARALLIRALQKCPTSGLLWCEAISVEARPLKKSKAMEALRRCPDNALILLVMSRIMEGERNIGSAKEHYERALSVDQNIGDLWAYYIIFCQKYYEGEVSRLMDAVADCKPKNGPLWKPFRKDSKWLHSPFIDVFTTFLNTLIQ